MDFTASFRSLFQSLLSDDEKVSQKAQLVVLACAYTVFTVAFALFVGIVQPDLMLRSVVSSLTTLLLSIASIWISQRGHTVAAGWLFVLGNIIFVTQRVLVRGG